MGTLKKHIGAYSVESAQLYVGNVVAAQTITYIPCKATDGTDMSQTYATQSSSADAWKFSNTFSMRGFNATATNDKLADFGVNDYLVTAVGTTTSSNGRTITSTSAKLTITVTVTNNTADDIEISCIRFTKQGCINTNGTLKNILCYSYYLDTPETIAVGDSKVYTIDFTINVGD